MQEMQQVMDDYLQAMAEQMMRQAQRAADAAPADRSEPDTAPRRSAAMLDQMRDMAKTARAMQPGRCCHSCSK